MKHRDIYVSYVLHFLKENEPFLLRRDFVIFRKHFSMCVCVFRCVCVSVCKNVRALRNTGGYTSPTGQPEARRVTSERVNARTRGAGCAGGARHLIGDSAPRAGRGTRGTRRAFSPPVRPFTRAARISASMSSPVLSPLFCRVGNFAFGGSIVAALLAEMDSRRDHTVRMRALRSVSRFDSRPGR